MSCRLLSFWTCWSCALVGGGTLLMQAAYRVQFSVKGRCLFCSPCLPKSQVRMMHALLIPFQAGLLNWSQNASQHEASRVLQACVRLEVFLVISEAGMAHASVVGKCLQPGPRWECPHSNNFCSRASTTLSLLSLPRKSFPSLGYVGCK